MIILVITKERYFCDIRGIIAAFYPGEEIDTHKTIEQIEPSDTGIQVTEENMRYVLTFRQVDKQLQETVEIDIKQDEKNILKRAVYQFLHKITGKVLPWGTLTGIRPTKMVLQKWYETKEEKEVIDWMQKEYLCQKEKALLCAGIVKKEAQLFQTLGEDTYSLYIGIPFCPSICSYCSFSSYPLKQYEMLIEPYLQALLYEIEQSALLVAGKKLVSVYIGGGTPTTLSAKQLELLCQTIRRFFSFEEVLEFTVEAGRPDSITREKLTVLKQYGVTRVSVNPQTMQQKTLDLVGRKHTIEQVYETMIQAKQVGFAEVNMDLILGLPKETHLDVRETIKHVCSLEPENITLHTLAMKRAARLNQWKKTQNLLYSSDIHEQWQEAVEWLQKMSYEPYYLYRQKNMAGNLENVGYAKPGKIGVYNCCMIEEYHTILALGAGAVTKWMDPKTKQLQRIETVKSPSDYIHRISEMVRRKEKIVNKA